MVMVKYLLPPVFLVALLTSCGQEPVQEQNAFQTERFRLNSYTGNVSRFLQARPETRKHMRYQALFINTKECSSCTLAAFQGMTPFLEHTKRQLFIYVNDSSLIGLIPPNPHVDFVCLPLSEFESKGIFHGTIYLYDIGKTLHALDLTPARMDSLNLLPKE